MDFESLTKDPNKVGFPTFEQYAKNPTKYHDLYFGKESQAFDSVANGSSNPGLQHATHKVTYEIGHYRCKTMEEVERIARDMGINLRTLEYKAIIRNMGGQRGEVLVKFMSKEEYERRQKW